MENLRQDLMNEIEQGLLTLRNEVSVAEERLAELRNMEQRQIGAVQALEALFKVEAEAEAEAEAEEEI